METKLNNIYLISWDVDNIQRLCVYTIHVVVILQLSHGDDSMNVENTARFYSYQSV